MPGKPTYEEIEQRLKDLDKESVNCKRTEEALQKSEKRFKNVTNSIEELLVLLDQNFKVQMINSKLAKAYNVSLNEFPGKYCYELFYGRKHICEGCPAIKVLNEGKVIRGALRYRPDGRIFDRTAYPFIEDNGDITGVIVIGCDIAQQKQAEEKLRESEEKYRLLVESTPDWVWMCDRKSRHTFSNNSVKEILGYEIHEILGTTALNLIHKEDRKSVQKWFQNAKKQKRGWRGSVIRWHHKDKSIRFLETIAEPIFDDKGNLIGYSGIDRDVTARKLSEMALQKAHDELQEKTIRLEVKKISLEEINTAIKVLLKKREEDKIEIEKNVLTNVKELIEPYFEKIKKTKLDDQQEALLSIIESYLNEIVSPFTRKMSLKYLNLTPTEIQIANLIRHGSSTKKIAEIMNVSPRTIETHRKNIRRKIGLESKRANLRSHLLSLH
ncbi:MAG: PAS domain S-box protein [Deltaproteobacteria bacterium]|nr:PAS domain S-box protein [Deltaproteobacteria bacterium]